MDTNEITTVDNSAGKSWYTSKTVWFNVLTILLTAATFFGYTPADYQHTADQTTSILLMVAPFINVALRFYTNKRIG